MRAHPVVQSGYGTVPIVRRTGGLADTVVDCGPKALESGKANGFFFDHAWAAELLGAIDRALDTFRNKAVWRKLQRNGMTLIGWEKAAPASTPRCTRSSSKSAG